MRYSERDIMEKRKQSLGKESEKIKSADAQKSMSEETPKFFLTLDTKILVLALVGIVVLFFVTYTGVFSDFISSDKVIATVNGVEIRESELQEEINKLPEYYKTGMIDEQTIRTAILEQLIAREVLLGEAAQKGIVVTADELDTTIANISAEAQISLDELAQKLEEQNVTMVVFRETVEKQMLINKLVEQEVLAGVAVTEDEIVSYYESRKEALAEVRASHILICYEGAMRCEESATKEEAFAQAEMLIERIKAGENFEELAKEYSTDPSAEFNGGDLGWFTKGQMVAEFEIAAFALNAGEMAAEPVETVYGYHIIMVVDKKETLDAVKEEIVATLMLEKQKQVVEEYIFALKQAADIVYEE